MTVPNVTYSRCVRVQKALESDDSFASLLGTKEHVVHRPPPSNAPVKFSEGVIAITHAISESGDDPAAMGQRGIQRFAMNILAEVKDGKPFPKFDPVVVPPEPAPAAPKPKPTPKPKAKAKAKVKVKPLEPLKRRPARQPSTPAINGPLVPPEGQPKPDPEKPGRHMAEQLVLGQKENHSTSRLTAPELVEPLPQPVLDEDVRSAPAGNLPFVWGVSANTLILSAIQLVDQAGMGDSSLCKRLTECSNDIVRLTIIPRNAKENPSSPNRVTAH